MEGSYQEAEEHCHLTVSIQVCSVWLFGLNHVNDNPLAAAKNKPIYLHCSQSRNTPVTTISYFSGLIIFPNSSSQKILGSWALQRRLESGLSLAMEDDKAAAEYSIIYHSFLFYHALCASYLIYNFFSVINIGENKT